MFIPISPPLSPPYSDPLSLLTQKSVNKALGPQLPKNDLPHRATVKIQQDNVCPPAGP